MSNKENYSGNHFHTPSENTSRIRIFWDTLLSSKWTDPFSHTARCSHCGALIRQPRLLLRYEQTSYLLTGAILASAEYIPYRIFPIARGSSGHYLVAFLLFFTVFTIIPLLISGLAAWEIVPIINRNEKQAIEKETKRAKLHEHAVLLYLIVAVFSYVLLKVIYTHSLGW